MGLYRDLQFVPLADGSDPDDWRPGPRLGPAAGVGGGDSIPLHRHRIDEVVVYLAGEFEVRLGEESLAVRAGDIVVIPAGVVHSQRNTGSMVGEIRAVFPSARIDIEYIDRNPAPGTEGDPPQPPIVIDAHTGAVAPAT